MNQGASIVAAMLAALLVATAQQPPRFRSGVELVELDVSVLDRDRRPVRGLTAHDFMVLEDGKPQEILSVAEIDVPEPVAAPTPWMRDVTPDVRANLAAAERLIVLVLDDAQVRMQPVMTQTVREIGRRILDRLGPADLAAVVFTRNNSGAQPFTSDRARLLAAVEKFQAGFGGSAGGGDSSTEHFYKASLRTLKYVAESMASADQRRKAVIYVGPGLPLTGGGSGPLYPDAEALFREAQRANVNIYSIDPSGLGALDSENPELAGLPADAAGRVHAINNDFLHSLAANTGGLAILNRNEFTTGVTQIFRENGSYYLVGYRSSGNAPPGQYRRIDVRVFRPGLLVRVRNGYFGPREAGRADPEAASPELLRALASIVPVRDVALQATAAPFQIPGRRQAAIAIVLAVREFVPPGEERITEQLDVLVGAYTTDGRRDATRRMKATVLLKPRPGAPAIFEVLSHMPLKPGRYQLRFAAESQMEARSGSVYYDVDVPAFWKGEFATSGLMLSVTPNVPVAPPDALTALLPIVPTARRQFWATDRVSAFLRLYQPGKRAIAPVIISARIRDERDAVTFEQADEITPAGFAKDRTAEYRLDLPVDTLARGPYVLTFEAACGPRTTRQHVRFVRQ
jgi:VWFA-related protein